jgi:hypothetical protein
LTLDPADELLPRREVDIDEALDRVRLYLSQLAFAGTQAGSLRVDTVYVNVASAIIQSVSSNSAARDASGVAPKSSAFVEREQRTSLARVSVPDGAHRRDRSPA